MHITTKIWQKERSCIKITRRKRKRIDQLIKVMGNVHNYAPSAMKNRINAGVFSLLFRLIKTSLPKSRLLSCFPFLLKKLRFLHDIHLPKFMTAIQTLQIYTHTQWRKRKRKTSNPEQEDKVVAAALVVVEWVSERTRKKKEKRKRKWRCDSIHRWRWVGLCGVPGRALCHNIQMFAHTRLRKNHEWEKQIVN